MSPLAYQPSLVKARALCSAARKYPRGVYGPRVSNAPGVPSGTGSPLSSTTRISSAVADGPALGSENDLEGVVEAGHVEQALGHAEDLLQPRSQDRLDAGGELVGHAGAAHLQHAEAVAAQRAVLTLVARSTAARPPEQQRRR